MKRSYSIVLLIIASFLLNSCSKEEYFKSESGINDQLQGTWDLIPIPKYDYNSDGSKYVHIESWTFHDNSLSIINNGQNAVSTYSVHTTISKAEIKVDDVQPLFTPPARVRDNNCSGTWQIVSLDDDYMTIANDQDGHTGLTILEFEKKN